MECGSKTLVALVSTKGCFGGRIAIICGFERDCSKSGVCVGGGEGNHIGELDSGRLGWNGIGASNWHGLLNSPLM